MGSNQDEIELRDVVFDDGCSEEVCPDAKWKDSDDSESFKSCEDISDLLPNDPFDMEFKRGLPNDPFGMDVNMSLPRDPFGMDFDIGATVAAITGWIEDFGLNTCGFDNGDGSEDKKSDDNKLFAGLNFVWTSLMEFEEKEGGNGVSGAGSMTQFEEGLYGLGDNTEEVACFGSEKYLNGYGNDCGDLDGGDPADAFFFALGYLGIKDLFSVGNVCKSLRDAVQNDPLLWRHILIDGPLSDKITDDRLVQLTNRAQGNLRSLSLIKCSKITRSGLKQVLDSNLGLIKLSVPGCLKLKIDEVLHDVKLYNSIGMPGVKQLRIGDLVGMTDQLLKEFKLLLRVDEGKRANYNPRFYNVDEPYLSLDDERPIDVEICPRCEHARQVYDCPVESCQMKPGHQQRCRACLICIARCITCGCCFKTTDYEETFCLDYICLKCLARFLKDQDNVSFSSYFHQKTSYHFFLYHEEHGLVMS